MRGAERVAGRHCQTMFGSACEDIFRVIGLRDDGHRCAVPYALLDRRAYSTIRSASRLRTAKL